MDMISTFAYRIFTDKMTEWMIKLALILGENILPHGSGIDSTWFIELDEDNNFICHNSYHAMDEYGGYCHWYDFMIQFSYNELPMKECKYCHNTGIRTVESFRFNDLSLSDTRQRILDNGYKLVDDKLICNVCNGSGYLVNPIFEYLDFSMDKIDCSECGWGLDDYLQDILYMDNSEYTHKLIS